MATDQSRERGYLFPDFVGATVAYIAQGAKRGARCAECTWATS